MLMEGIGDSTCLNEQEDIGEECEREKLRDRHSFRISFGGVSKKIYFLFRS